MNTSEISFTCDIYSSSKELAADDAHLLQEAKEAISLAYAPYSKFRVGAAARLSNGNIVRGSNQENASFPAGICAERVLLSAVSSLQPGISIETMAITYLNGDGGGNHPISPCGICRQTLQEFEYRQSHPIRLMLAGSEGPVYVIPRSGDLLPLNFSADDLLAGS